jgi:mevalonate kinase
MDKGRAFFGKIMLFGEYSVIHKARALTIPLPNFSGRFSFVLNEGDAYSLASNKLLKDYLDFLKQGSKKPGYCRVQLNLEAFEADLENGLFFQSDIPQGYGAGSSGALVAAVYERYAPSPVKHTPLPDSKKLEQLKRDFAHLETFFHGTSSGIDPLSCFLAKPLLIDAEQGFLPAEIPPFDPANKLGFFLLDTQMIRQTEPLVNTFREKYQNLAFQSFFHNEYIPLVDQCIDALITGDSGLLLKLTRKLSDLQLKHFSQMIPSKYSSLWQQGIDSGKYFLKLCGAGGGGFILGVTNELPETCSFLSAMGAQCHILHF